MFIYCTWTAANPFQSGAIMDYILEQYDTEKRISFSTIPERYHMKQWLEYQVTTQGPVLQRIFHWTFQKPNPTARASYVKDFRHVLQILNDELADKEWLVGDKCSAADLSIVPFHSRLSSIMGDDKPNIEVEYPHVAAWYKRMLERDTVQKVLADHGQVFKDLAAKGVKIPGSK